MLLLLCTLLACGPPLGDMAIQFRPVFRVHLRYRAFRKCEQRQGMFVITSGDAHDVHRGPATFTVMAGEC